MTCRAHRSTRVALSYAVVFAIAAATCLPASAADGTKTTAVDARVYTETVNKAIGYFQKAQAADGSFSASAGPAVTALVATAILQSGRSPDDPLVAKSLKYVAGFVRPDGGIYADKSGHQNYETCVVIQCFHEANRDGRYNEIIKNAEAFVKGLQWDEKEGQSKADANYGGAGYGSSKRPDLSNTAFLLDALHSIGRGPEDEAVQKALIFVSRCQNLETEYNTTGFAAKNPDGGFYYTPSAGGSSPAGKTDDGGLRSYAAMTYAGLKSMIFAGLGPDDPRVKAATAWIKQHYSVEENPGIGNSGLYYYYQTFAKALAAAGIDRFQDSAGANHDWRSDLVAQLASLQKPDGSWVNATTRWMEGDPNLVTAYSLIALANCRAK